MKRLSRRQILVLVVVFLVAIQIPPPPRAAPPVKGVVAAPPEVMSVLKAACWDCHSSETRWPAYSRVAPLSWWIGWHVSHGREYLNFTAWDQLQEPQRTRALHEIAEVVEKGEMPLASYTWMHPEARLTDAQKQLIIDWARSRSPRGRDGKEHHSEEED